MSTQQADLDKIKGKLEKLVKLQQGATKIGSLEEAANAAEKIQTLLFKYNLSMADINTDEQREEDIKNNSLDLSELGRVKTSGRWMETLVGVIARNNLCQVVWAQPRCVIFGNKENIEVVTLFSIQLISRIQDMAKQSWKEYNGPEKRNSYIRGYTIGAVAGIAIKLKENKAELEKQSNMTALVVANEKLVQEAMKTKFHNLKSGRRSSSSSQDGRRQGVKDGKNMNIHKAIN